MQRLTPSKGALRSATIASASLWIESVAAGMGSTPVLVAGLVLTTATQLRVAFMPVGVGEATLAAWIAGRLLSHGRTEASTRFEAPVFVLFWIIACPLLAIGFWNASRRGVVAAAAAHDTAAYVFVILFIVVLTRGPQARERVQSAASIFSVALPLFLGLVLVGAWIWHPLGKLCFTADAVPRFRAFATNPNQVMFALVTTPFLLLRELNDRSAGLGRRLTVAAFVTALGVGLSIRSDALLMSWALVGAALTISVLRRALRSGRWRLERDPWNAGGAFVSVVAVIGLALSVQGTRNQDRRMATPEQTATRAGDAIGAVEAVEAGLPQAVENRFVGKYGEPTAGGRFLYWRTGLAAIRSSPIAGYGPGAHTGTSAPFENMEAHNVLLDWYLATGVFGALTLLMLAGFLFVKAFRPLQEVKASMWLALVVVGMLHFYLRQPVAWFLLVFIAL